MPASAGVICELKAEKIGRAWGRLGGGVGGGRGSNLYMPRTEILSE